MNDHRWPRATITDIAYGPLCDCGNLKTDQALTCTAVERRRAPDYWETRTCACGGPKTGRAAMCRACKYEAMRGVTRLDVGRPQPESHPWRAAEAARLAA
jgi:hypothetical protein